MHGGWSSCHVHPTRLRSHDAKPSQRSCRAYTETLPTANAKKKAPDVLKPSTAHVGQSNLRSSNISLPARFCRRPEEHLNGCPLSDKNKDPVIKAPPTSHSSREKSANTASPSCSDPQSQHTRQDHKQYEPTKDAGQDLVSSRTGRVQYWTTVDTLNCSNRAQAMSVENIHLLSPFYQRRTGTRPVPRKAAKKRCSTREREESAPTTNRREDTDETRKKTTWTDKKSTGHPWLCISAHVCCAARVVRALVGGVYVD